MTDEAPTPAPADNVTPAPDATAQTTQSTADWRASLPEELRSNKTLDKFTSQEALAASYVNLERMIGMDKVVRPKGDFDPAHPDWQPFLDAAGRPKSPDEYKFSEAKMPDGLAYDGSLENKFRGTFHMAGLNPKQAEILRDAFVAHQAETYQTLQTEIANDTHERREAMKRELGSAYDGLSRAAEVAQKEFVTETLLAKIEAAGLSQDPEWLKVFGTIGKKMIGDEKLKNGGLSIESSPAEWKDKADAFMSQNAAALFDKMHPDHRRLTDEYTRMMQRAFPT